MHSPEHFRQIIDRKLIELSFPTHPAELYDPIRYMLSLGGKRLRPSLLLMANELFGGEIEHAINPALGIEVFHNFTLMHDDIMDKAPLRRTKPTVHTKWNPNTAILSGDTMFVKACMLMMDVSKTYQHKVMDLFLRTAAEVCEGQQVDMNFELREDVSIPEYIEMIRLKTAVLLASSLQTGAILAGAKEEDAQYMYEFGKNLGIAFQLHDDILDLYAESDKFGKQTGGDIVANKKTILILLAMESGSLSEVELLRSLINDSATDPEKKVYAVRDIFENLDIRKKALEMMDVYFQLAMDELSKVSTDSMRKEPMLALANRLMVRET